MTTQRHFRAQGRATLGVLGGLLLWALGACTPFGGQVKAFSGAEPALQNRVKALVNVAQDLGWKTAFVPDQVVEGPGRPLGTLVTQEDAKAVPRSLAVWDPSQVAAAQPGAPGAPKAEAALWHARPWVDLRSPLPAAARQWTDAELAEWLAWEWAADRLGVRTDRQAAQVSFFAYKFAEAVVTRLQGPGSPELARWREGVRDRQTFELLVADLRDQVRGIVAAQADPAERKATLERIERHWLDVFHQQYMNRFLTNDHQAFGADGWVEPVALEQIPGETLGWKDWDPNRSFDSAAALWDQVVGTAAKTP